MVRGSAESRKMAESETAWLPQEGSARKAGDHDPGLEIVREPEEPEAERDDGPSEWILSDPVAGGRRVSAPAGRAETTWDPEPRGKRTDARVEAFLERARVVEERMRKMVDQSEALAARIEQLTSRQG
jgi:hypothetical protein